MQRIDEVRAQFESMLAGVRATMWRDDCMLVPSDIRQLVGEIDRLCAEVERLREATDEMEEALARIVQWSDAYPLDIFPEPDLLKARMLLQAGGITIDAVSASAMRHVVESVGKIARTALSPASEETKS